MKAKLGLILFTLISILVSCSSPTAPAPTPTSTLVPTATSIPTQNAIPTPTPQPQPLGRIFSEGFHGQAVWSNADGNPSRDFRDRGWFCPPDGSSTICRGVVIHFDVSLPNGFSKDDYILSPVNGFVEEIYGAGEGMSIHILPDSAIEGDRELISNMERIKTLAKGVFSFKYKADDLKYSSLHLAHVIPLVSEGDQIQKGQQIAQIEFDVPFNPKTVAYVIYLHMKDGKMYQFSPCDVSNEDEFCGQCSPGTPYICP